MAIRRRIELGGLNTDLPAEQLSTGTASVATNVIVRDGVLKKRAGFDQWEDDVTGAGDGILNMFTAKFADGTTYVVCKMDDGNLWHREVGQVSFTQITDKWGGHTTTEAGSFFMWADRLHYSDSNGVTKWESVLGPKKGGIGVGATPTASATTGGAKDGRYHVYSAYRNSVTGEFGLHGLPSTGVVCEFAGNNAIAVASISADSDYEIDQLVLYSTMGHTEYIGAGTGIEVWSGYAFIDKMQATGSATMTMPDDLLRRETQFSTRWGEPPAAPIVSFNGERACYAGIVDGIINFSINRFPCAVPVINVFTTGNFQAIQEPEPWESWISTGMIGPVTEMVFGGGVFGVYTDTDTWVLIEDRSDGRLRPFRRRVGRGCVVHQAATAADDGIHAIGYRSWTILNSGGVRDLSFDRFVTTLTTIPVASQTKTRMATFSFQDQVWAAVVGADETYAQNILIWDRLAGTVGENGRAIGALTIFEIQGMAATEDITCMSELSYATAEPTMLVGTDAGRILQYPSLVGDDNLAGTRKHYGAEWRGYVGTERMAYKNRLESLKINAGDNVEGHVTLTFRSRFTSDEDRSKPDEFLLDRTDLQADYGGSFTNPNANFYEIGFVSTADHTEQWTITAVTVAIAGLEART